MHRRPPVLRHSTLPALLALALTACGGGGGGGDDDALAPSVRLERPDADVVQAPGGSVRVEYRDEGDAGATTTVLADQDGDLQTVADQIRVSEEDVGDGSPRQVLWDLTGVPLGTYRIFAVTDDGSQPPAIDEAIGVVTVSSLSFVRIAGGARRDSGFAVEALADGGFFVAGSIRNDVTFDIGGPTQTSFDADGIDSFVARYDAAGNLVWVRSWGAPSNFVQEANDVSAFADGSCVVTGSFVGLTVFGEGETNEVTLNGENGDIFFARFNANGTLAWAKRANAEFADQGEAVVALPDGSSIFACEFQREVTVGEGEVGETTITGVPGGSSQDVFLARLSASGELLWTRHVGSSGIDTVEGIVLRGQTGTVLIGGFHAGELVLGRSEANEATLPGGAAYVAAYDVSGNLVFARNIGTTGGFSVSGFASFPDGSAAIAGSYQNTVTIDPGGALEQILTAQDGREVLLMRLAENGSLEWFREARGASSDQALDVTVLADGSVALVGFFFESLTFGAGLPSQRTLTSAGDRDLFLARFGGDGTFRLAARAGGVGAVQGNAVAASVGGTVLVTGNYGGTSTWGAGTPGATTRTEEGENDIFVARYHGDGSL